MRARNRFLEKGSLEGMWSMIPPSNSNKRYDEEEIEYLAKSQAKNRGPQKSSPPELRKTRGGGGGNEGGRWRLAGSLDPSSRPAILEQLHRGQVCQAEQSATCSVSSRDGPGMKYDLPAGGLFDLCVQTTEKKN